MRKFISPIYKTSLQLNQVKETTRDTSQVNQMSQSPNKHNIRSAKDIFLLIHSHMLFQNFHILTVPILSFSLLFLRFESLNRSYKNLPILSHFDLNPLSLSSIPFSSVLKQRDSPPIQSVKLFLIFNPIFSSSIFLLLLLWFREFRSSFLNIWI